MLSAGLSLTMQFVLNCFDSLKSAQLPSLLPSCWNLVLKIRLIATWQKMVSH